MRKPLADRANPRKIVILGALKNLPSVDPALIERWGEVAVYFLLSKVETDALGAIAEGPMEEAAQQLILHAVADALDRQPRDIGAALGFGTDAYDATFGFHTSASVDSLRAAFEADGFQRLTIEQALHPLGFPPLLASLIAYIRLQTDSRCVGVEAPNRDDWRRWLDSVAPSVREALRPFGVDRSDGLLALWERVGRAGDGCPVIYLHNRRGAAVVANDVRDFAALLCLSFESLGELATHGKSKTAKSKDRPRFVRWLAARHAIVPPAEHETLIAKAQAENPGFAELALARSAKPRSKSKASLPDVAKTAELIEAYCERLRGIPSLSLRPEVLEPQSAKAIASITRHLGVFLPEDLRVFYARGLRACTGSIAEPFASLGFEFLPAAKAIEHTQMLREVAQEGGENEKHAEVILKGIALTFEEPQLVLSEGGLYHFSFRNDLLELCGSFSEFLHHYLAAGCFSSHDFQALWKIVQPHVPIDVPVEKNVWVSAYRSQHPE